MGLPGALVAVPVAAAMQFLAQEFYMKPLNTDSTTDGATPCVDELESKQISCSDLKANQSEI